MTYDERAAALADLLTLVESPLPTKRRRAKLLVRALRLLGCEPATLAEIESVAARRRPQWDEDTL